MNGGENNEFVCRVFKRRGKRARNKLFLPICYARGSSYDCLILLGMIYCRDSTFKHPYIKVTRSVDALYKRSSFLLFFFFFSFTQKKYEDSYEIDYKSDTVVLKFQETFRELREKRSNGNNLQNERQAKKKTQREIDRASFQKLVPRRLVIPRSTKNNPCKDTLIPIEHIKAS